MCFRWVLGRRKKTKSRRTAALPEGEVWAWQEMPAAKCSYSSYAKELEEVFRRFDTNGDGKLTWEDLGRILSSLGQRMTPEELQRMVGDVDVDGDGCISLGEFIQLNKKGVAYGVTLQDIHRAFSLFDVNGDGFISCEELFVFLTKVGDSPTMADCRRMIQAVDGDGDGLIDFEDFKHTLMGCSRRVRVQ